jgi:hypothetical protein
MPELENDTRFISSDTDIAFIEEQQVPSDEENNKEQAIKT